jgi:hypothetical protein
MEDGINRDTYPVSHLRSGTMPYSALYSLTSRICLLKRQPVAEHQWLTPVILATQEAEIRRILVQVVCETPS